MRHCTTIWGDAEYNPHQLQMRKIEDAVYIPFSSQVYLDRDTSWGVYTGDGYIVSQAAYVRGANRELVGQSLYNCAAKVKVLDAPVDEMIYGGAIVPHFGHFLISSLARLWAERPNIPFLFHSSPPIFEHRAEYICEIVKAAGLTPNNCFSFDKPTRIKRLYVPEASIIEQSGVSPQYSVSVAKLGKKFSHTERFQNTRCYLSKSDLARGITGLDGERYIEEAFCAAGFEILRPETLSIAEQVNLFRSASVIVGTASSAFHMAALTPDSTASRFLFGYSDAINSNFSLIDFDIRGKSYYFSLSGHVEETSNVNFLSYYRAVDPKPLGSLMVSTVEAICLRQNQTSKV